MIGGDTQSHRRHMAGLVRRVTVPQGMVVLGRAGEVGSGREGSVG